MRIGLVGKAGVGKTTIANILVEKYGFVRLSFAAKLKEVAAEILGRPIDKTRDRLFLQTIGAAVRMFDTSAWIRHVWRELRKLPRDANVVIDDVRYLNEAEFLRDHGFVLVRLYGRGYSLDPKEATHESEVEQDQIKVDFEVNVNVPLKRLPKLVDELLKVISGGKPTGMYTFKITRPQNV